MITVLAARFSAIGDVAMTVPVIYSACRCYPDIQFTFFTRKAMAAIFLNAPANLTVVGLDLSEYTGVQGIWRLFREARRKYWFDAFIDLHDVLRTKIFRSFCHMARIPVSVINKGRKGKRALTRPHNKVLLPLISSRARYRQTFHAIGLPVQTRFEGLFGEGKGSPELFARITSPRLDGERWVGIAPFAKHSGKIYPPALMEQVVKAVSAMPGTKIFLFGGGHEEEEVLGMWAERYPRTESLAGKRYGFPAELALVSQLDVMVSMDSANMHLASLVRTPVVSVWGATHPYCGFKGWRQSDEDMVQLPMTCRPCSVFGNKSCFRGDYHCLRGIAPQVIIDRISHYLGENAHAVSGCRAED
ncbi:MAG: glycosyltransferase family 9 protein [Muribaculaceae bacterium]|nr:glycosyltransferase family 9 protein [Muribaculaceae bacterium]